MTYLAGFEALPLAEYPQTLHLRMSSTVFPSSVLFLTDSSIEPHTGHHLPAGFPLSAYFISSLKSCLEIPILRILSGPMR